MKAAVRLEGIQTFVEIVSAGSLTEAAARLSLSKSVVSQRLTALENTLGTQLLRRSARRVGLTEAGEAFYQRCSRVLADLDEATAAAGREKDKLFGPVRLSAPNSFGVLHLGPARFSFVKQHPNIELKVELNDRMVNLVNEGYDLAIRIGFLRDSTMVARKLTVSRRVVVCSPAYAAKWGLPRTLTDLESHLAISFCHVWPMQEWLFRVDGKVTSARIKTAMQVDNGDMQRDAAIAGLGLTIIPTFLAYEALAQGKLVVVPIQAEPVPRGVYVVFPQSNHRSARIRALADHLFQAFDDPPYWDAALSARAA